MWPIVGSFARSAAATEPVPVFVRSPDVNSGDVLSTAVIPIDSDSPVTLSTGAAPIDCPVRRVAPELRVEVFSNIGLFNVPFTLTVGDVTGAFLACGLNRVCGTPTTIYYDNAQQSFDAIVTKNVADDQVINLQLYVDGVLRDSDHATQDDLTAKVHFDL
ncbi:MAG TPA: hypothetical protein VMW17_07345 [Candidatus Binatia bacterium]|nr:hypothetical protein [Candidatus Binatia bacterium]